MKKVCDAHLTHIKLADIRMVLSIEDPDEKCEMFGISLAENEAVECGRNATKVVYLQGENPTLSLPPRKEVIIQMHKELQMAIENGCVVEFSAEDRYLPNQIPMLTKYTFIVDKEAVVRATNAINQGK